VITSPLVPYDGIRDYTASSGGLRCTFPKGIFKVYPLPDRV